MEIEGLDEKILHKKRLHITELICWSRKCLKVIAPVCISSILYWTQKVNQSKVINDILQLKDCLNPMSKPYIFGPFLIICTLDLNKQWSVLSSSLPKFMLKIYITVRRMVYLSSNGGEKC